MVLYNTNCLRFGLADGKHSRFSGAAMASAVLTRNIIKVGVCAAHRKYVIHRHHQLRIYGAAVGNLFTKAAALQTLLVLSISRSLAFVVWPLRRIVDVGIS